MNKIEGWVTAPQGFIAAGVKAGIKVSGNHDVAVIYSYCENPAKQNSMVPGFTVSSFQ